MKKFLFSCFCAATLIFSASVAYAIDYDRLAPHPRLMLRSGDITAMRTLSTTSMAGRTVHGKIISAAERVIEQAVVAAPLNIAPEEVLERIFFLSYSYLTSDDMRYARRAEQEMLAVSALSDWGSNSSDVATLTMALAIGYDWLYRALPVHSRSIIGTAIYEKALRPMESATMTDAFGNVGMLFGALATADRAPEFCRTMIDKYFAANEQMLLQRSETSLYVDAWNREVALQAMCYEAMATALDNTVAKPKVEALQREARMMNYMVAPSLLFYNYGGQQAEAMCLPAKYWVAECCAEPSLVAVDEMLAKQSRFVENYTLPLYMLLAAGNDYSHTKLPNAKFWYDDQMVIYRSGWDKNDTYLAIKGGDAESAGEYILETGGVRWTSLTGDVDGRLVIDGVCSDGQGEVSLREVYEASRHHGAVVDVSSLYSSQAAGVVRTFELGKGDKLTVTDQVVCGAQPAAIEWSITTAAVPEIVAPNTISLTMSGQTMYMKVRTRGDVDAKIWPDENGVRRVGFVLTAAAGDTQNIEVTFTRQGSKGFSLSRLGLGRK